MNSVKKNIIYNTLYQILIFILPLITTPYVSRILGVNNIGIYSYSYSIVYYFIMFTLLGLNNYGNRSIAMVRDDKKTLSKCFNSIYIMQLLCSLSMIILYIIYCFNFSNSAISWTMLIFLISAGIDVNWLFFGLEQFKITIFRNAFAKIITTLCVFIFVKDQNDLFLYTIIMATGTIMSQILIWPFVIKYVGFCKVTFHDVVQHFKPNFILFIPVIAISLYKMMDKTMLGYISGTEQVGFYENSEKLTVIPLGIISAISTVMLPRISNLQSKGETNTINTYLNNSLIFAVVVSSLLVFGICGIAKEFVPIYFGPGYEQCKILMYIIMPSCIFIAIANVIRTQILIPQKRDIVYIKSVSLGAVVNLCLNLLFIYKFKAIGAAIGTFCAETIVCIYQIYETRDCINYKEIFRILTPSLMISIFMAITLIMIDLNYSDFVNFIIKVFLGGVIYISAHFLIYYKRIKETLRRRR